LLSTSPSASNDQRHADENVECRSSDASEEAVGNDNNVICLNGCSHASHGVAQAFAIHSQIASHGTGIVNVHGADMAMH
jgi:hypothetical protein